MKEFGFPLGQKTFLLFSLLDFYLTWVKFGRDFLEADNQLKEWIEYAEDNAATGNESPVPSIPRWARAAFLLRIISNVSVWALLLPLSKTTLKTVMIVASIAPILTKVAEVGLDKKETDFRIGVNIEKIRFTPLS